MANLKLYGQVVEILPQQVGTSKSGKQWFSQQFIVEEVSGNSDYSNRVCFTLMNKSLNAENMQNVFVGNDVTVSFNVSSREWTDIKGNRRFSCDLQAWKVETGDTTAAQAKKQSDENFTPVFASIGGAAKTVQPAYTTPPEYSAEAAQEVSENLPF